MIELSSPQQVARFLALLGSYSSEAMVNLLIKEGTEPGEAKTIVDEALASAAKIHEAEQAIVAADDRAIDAEHQ